MKVYFFIFFLFWERRGKTESNDGDDVELPPPKGIKSRKRIKDAMPTSENEEPQKTTHKTKPKVSNDHHSNMTKKRNKALKNESGASSSLIDESKEDDSSLISKCKNLTQICKTDGAKGLCDELSKW